MSEFDIEPYEYHINRGNISGKALTTGKAPMRVDMGCTDGEVSNNSVFQDNSDYNDNRTINITININLPENINNETLEPIKDALREIKKIVNEEPSEIIEKVKEKNKWSLFRR